MSIGVEPRPGRPAGPPLDRPSPDEQLADGDARPQWNLLTETQARGYVAMVRPLIGTLAIALAIGWLVAIALTPPVQLYSSAALYPSGDPPANVVPRPDWGAGAVAGGGVLLVLAGVQVVRTRRRPA
jgi:hypothetical protein